MVNYKKEVKNLFYIFLTIHLIVWTAIPSLTNNNLPLDTIEALAWGSNLDWGFNKHPPMSAFFPEIFYKIFGPQDWAFYLLSQIFVISSFFVVFKLGEEIFENKTLSILSVLLLEGIYFYNFTAPEFNANVCQLPFWTLTVYYAWRVFNKKKIVFKDCALFGAFVIFLGAPLDLRDSDMRGNIFALICSFILAISFLISEKVRQSERYAEKCYFYWIYK